MLIMGDFKFYNLQMFIAYLADLGAPDAHTFGEKQVPMRLLATLRSARNHRVKRKTNVSIIVMGGTCDRYAFYSVI